MWAKKKGRLLWMIIHLVGPTLLLKSNISFKKSAVCFAETNPEICPRFQDELLTVRWRCKEAHGYCLNSDLKKDKASFFSIMAKQNLLHREDVPIQSEASGAFNSFCMTVSFQKPDKNLT